MVSTRMTTSHVGPVKGLKPLRLYVLIKSRYRQEIVRRVCRLSNSPGILLTSNSGATYHRGTRLSLDQESCSDQSGVAGETRTDCRLGHAHRGGLTGVQPHPVTGPSVSPYSRPTAPGNKGPTAIPTAAVVLALFAQGALVQF